MNLLTVEGSTTQLPLGHTVGRWAGWGASKKGEKLDVDTLIVIWYNNVFVLGIIYLRLYSY